MPRVNKKRALAAKKAAEAKAKREAAKAKRAGIKAGDQPEEKKVSYRSATGVLTSRPRALDVKIEGFSLSVHSKLLVKDTAIEFTIGRRYGLLGRNGCGKSEFMKCMAEREVPIPDHIDIMYLEEEEKPMKKTALECVVEMAQAKLKRLESMVEVFIEEEGPDAEIVLDFYAMIDDMEPETFVPRASKLLAGLGFGEAMMAKYTEDMSGGWRMRVALAKCLFARPTLLLLDEPTNHLDLETVVWLGNYLSTYDRCLIVVSHSADFLNEVCTHTMELTPLGTLEYYTGSYDTYIKTKRENETRQWKQYKKEQDDIKHIKAFIASCGTFSNLVRQAKSKQKILDKMEAAGLTPRPQESVKYCFDFAKCEQLPPPLVAFQNVAFSYSGLEEDYLYRDVDLGLDMDSRVALVGPNGAGKSTLLKLINNDLTPCEGAIRRHLHLQFGRFHQHSTDGLDVAMTPLDWIIRQFPDKKQEVSDWRKALGRFGISGDQQTSPIEQLSDGVKSRIVFAEMAQRHPNILLLDEPTNHLDMECIDALADAINKFDGGLLLVSHDFRLIDQVAKAIWICDNGTVTPWKGDIRSYKQSLVNKMIKSGLLS